jgi:hypothetical protein
MSAQRDADAAGGPEPPAPDPHGLLADTPFDSMREAQRRATRAADAGPEPECPRCGSINLRVKQGGTASDCEHKRAEPYRCARCGCHFEEPAQQTTLEGFQ